MTHRIIGLRKPDGTVYAALLEDEQTGANSALVLADVESFWRDPKAFTDSSYLNAAEGEIVDLEHVEVVPPVLPSARIFCVGMNYEDHVAEGSFADQGVPSYPSIFARWTASLTVDGVSIPIPVDEEGLDWEGEVMAYVGSSLYNADPTEALGAVIAYSTFNDVSARRAQKLTTQWTLGKNADRSGPVGPLVPAREVGDLKSGLLVETRVNGQVVQSAKTSDMVHSVGDTLSLISRTMTVNPGDMLATGTPSGVGYARKPPMLLQPGDVVEVEVEGLGKIQNPVGPKITA